jgi:hypothetical protein
MASKTVTLKGKVKWAYTTRLDNFGNYSIKLYPTEESLNLFHTLKLKNGVKEDEDGKFITLRRPPQKKIGKKIVDFGPPKVFLGGEKFEEIIGDGSDVTVDLEVYSYGDKGDNPYGAGVGSRLEAITVDYVVPYVKKDGSSKDELDEEIPF